MRIVCGLNTSATALNAARFAADLADEQGGDVLFVHVIKPPWLAPHSARARRRDAEARQEIAACFDGLVEELQLTSVKPRLRLVVGDPAEALREMADAAGADLLVIGASRRGRRNRAIIGSVQDQLTRGSDRAVAVVPAGHVPTIGGRVVLAHDVMSTSMAGAEVAGRLAAAIDGSVKVIYDPHAGDAAGTGWSAYDTLRRATETIGHAAGDPVEIVTHRAAGEMLTVLGDEASMSTTGFVVVDDALGDRWPERLRGRPWVVAPRRSGPPAQLPVEVT
jgi:nucleotide-binding universal stress UspA family protein